MNKLSRRKFLAISCIPILVAKAAAHAAAFDNDAGLSVLMVAGDNSAVEGFATGGECPACSGHGAIVCPACDGTGMWTQASESAGLYQRESARASCHCAWCNERGETVCTACDGTGRTIGIDLRSEES